MFYITPAARKAAKPPQPFFSSSPEGWQSSIIGEQVLGMALKGHESSCLCSAVIPARASMLGLKDSGNRFHLLQRLLEAASILGTTCDTKTKQLGELTHTVCTTVLLGFLPTKYDKTIFMSNLAFE